MSLNNDKTGRNYGIDLLRLLSMFMVVVLHVLGRGGILKSVTSLTLRGELFWALEITCYCAVNVFAIISGYVGLKAKHKASNLINLCLQVVFYAILITGSEIAILLITGSEISFKTIILHLFPTLRAMWYFSAYFCLFFFMPILNSIIENIPKKTLQSRAIFVFLIFCCATQLTTKVSNLAGGYSVLWLAILYLLGAYMSKYKTLDRTNLWGDFLGFIVCVTLTIISRIAIGYLYAPKINLMVSYTSPTIVLSAIFLVSMFSKINMRALSIKAVSFLSPMAFGVYLIHCHPYLFDYMTDAFEWIANLPPYYALLVVLLVALSIFTACLFIDYIRYLTFKLCKVNKLSNAIERFFTKIINGTLKLFNKNEEQNNLENLLIDNDKP